MPQATPTQPGVDDIAPPTLAFYRDVLRTLKQAELPFLIGGAYALNLYTRVQRTTRDFDVFIARRDYESIARALEAAGYRTELTYPHWLAKVYCNGDTFDLIFNSGNGITEVDQSWFDHAWPAEVLGIEALICPAEEMLWSKAYIMERERFDGADVAHLILAQGRKLDWPRILKRFGDHWRLLLSHLILFGFIYPAERNAVPDWVMSELLHRLAMEGDRPEGSNICGGTLLSREQYLSDVSQCGFQDARLTPHGNMSREDAALWTEAIKNKFN